MRRRTTSAIGWGTVLAALVAASPAVADAPPTELSFELGLGAAVVQPDGTVTVEATYTCNALVDGGDTFLRLWLTQTRGHRTAVGSGLLDGGFVCDDTTRSRTFVVGVDEGRFRTGPASASVWVNACGFDPRCVQGTLEERVRLR